MSAGPLKRLTVSYLRGAVSSFTLMFEKGKPLTIIYGENATGKSTICDALEFIGVGNVGSLDDRGLGKTAQYWHTIGKASTDISVSLETSEGMCTAACRKGIVIAMPPQQRPRVRVLRRAQILELLNAMPAERYANIRHFIDVSEIEQAEKSLRALEGSLRASLETAATRVQENREAIQQFWEEAGKPGANALAWCASEVAQGQETTEEEIARLERAKMAYEHLRKAVDDSAEGDAELRRVMEQRETAHREYLACAAALSMDAPDMVRILEAARRFLAHHPNPTECPLCGSPERSGDLAARIESRLGELGRLQAARALLDRLQRSEELEHRACQAGAVSIRSAAAALREAIEHPGCQLGEKLQPLPDNLRRDELASWLETTVAMPGMWAKAIAGKRGREAFATSLKRAQETLVANTETAAELATLLPRVVETLKVMGEQRRSFTDSMLSRIAVEVGRLYEEVHPGEGLSKITLALDPAKRASLEIEATFAGEEGAPPQAYFSDSHLDTLGLCMFLALSALDDQEETILVLDDVLGSVDEPHVDRLIEMLYAEATKYRHCVITTHYRPWKQKLRWGWLQNGQCQFVELSKWTGKDGLALIRSVPDCERLRRLLQETTPDPQLVCAKAGVMLEAALEFLTLLFGCSVPRRQDGQYTLGDLLPAIDKKLRKALQIEIKVGQDASGKPLYDKVPLAPYFDELTRIAQLRNVFGCHFNVISFELLESDALNFGRQVLGFMEALADDEGGWPRNLKSGMYWSNGGETRRLYPVQKPV